MAKENIGKKCYIKFGTFHGMSGKIQSVVHINGHDRYLVQLDNGKTIPKKVVNVIIFGGVHHGDNNKTK